MLNYKLTDDGNKNMEIVGAKWPERQTLPEPWEELTLDEYLLGTDLNPWGMPEAEGFTQLFLPDSGHGPLTEEDFKRDGSWPRQMTLWAVHFRKYHNRCYAMASIYQSADKAIGAYRLSDGDGHYVHDMRFFRIGCTHEHMQELSMAECRELKILHFGNCYHVSKCEACGFVRAIDSSG